MTKDDASKQSTQINMSYGEMVNKFRAVERKGEHLPHGLPLHC